MADDGFDAGSIFVQVVPSFRDTQRIIERESEGWGDELEKQLAGGMERGAEKGAQRASKKIRDTLTDGVGADADKAGEKAATEYAGAFRTTLQKAVKAMEREIKPIELQTASSKTLAELAKVKAELKALSEIDVKPGMDVRGVLAEAAKIEAAIKAISTDLDVDVKFDTKAALGQWRGLVKEMEALAPKMEIKVDDKSIKAAQRAADDLIRQSEKSATAIEKQAEAAMGSFQRRIRAGIKAAAGQLGAGVSPELAALRRALDDLGKKEIGFNISAEDAMRELERVHLELAQINALDPTVDVRVDSGNALRELQKINREVDTLDKATKKQKANDGLIARLLGGSGSGGQGLEVANAFRTFNGVLLATATLGPALIPILAGVAGGLAAIGPAALAGVSGLGVLVLAFGGIGDAVSALMEQEQNAAKDAVSITRTMRNAARGVEDAERSLIRTRRDAAQAAKDASNAVARAEEDAAERNAAAVARVADARARAAQALDSAAKRQGDAERRLADTQRDATEAQEDLRQARLQAQADLDDIADRSKQNALDIRQATIDLFNATVANNATQADPGATNLEKEQASINLESARLRMEELRETQGELATEKDKADKGNVDGTAGVIAAQERLNDALEAQRRAQEEVAESAADMRTTQQEGIQSVSEAVAAQRQTIEDGQEAIEAAEEARRRTGIANSEAIEDATRNLQRAQQSYNDSLYDTGELGSASAQKVRDAFGKLGPEAQQFALFIFGLRDEFYKLRAVAAAGLLPGVQEMLQTLITEYGPGFTKFVGDIASTLGDLSVKLGEALTSDTFREFFGLFAEAGPDLVNEFGLGFIEWLEVGTELMILALPAARKFAGWLTDIGERANQFLDSPEGIDTMSRFFAYVDRIAPKIEKFFAALGSAIINIAVALAPVGEDILTAVTNILEFVGAMDPETLKIIVVGLLGMFAAFQLAAGATFLLGAAMSFVTSPLQIIIVIIGAVILALYLLYTRSDTARAIIDAAFRGIAAVATWLFNEVLKPAFEYTIWIWGKLVAAFKDLWDAVLKPVFTELGTIVKWLWEKIVSPYLGFVIALWAALAKAFKWTWENILWPVIKVVAEIIWKLWLIGFKVAFEKISAGWDLLAAAFKWTWDNVLKPLFDLFMKYIGDDLVKVFETAVGFIKKHWDTLKGIAMAPISFVVDVILNKGLIPAFNKLAETFQMDGVEPVPWPPPGFAKGGVYPGYTPGRDIGYIGISGGEAIMRPEWTRAMQQLDPDYIDEANRRARTGGVGAVRRYLGGFKNGGEVGRAAPAGVFERTTFRGKQFNLYTVRMIEAAERLLGRTIRITQGSFSTSVAASGSTHAGGGALDAHMASYGPALRNAIVAAFRTVGFAAWLRTPSQGPWPYHMHAIAAGDPTASPAAQRQVQSYFQGGDGLGGKDDGPAVPKDPSMLERIAGGLGDLAGWAKEALGNPAKWLREQVGDKLGKLKEQFGDNFMTKMLSKIPERIIGGMVDRVKGLNPFDGGGANGDLKGMAKEMLGNFGWGQYWNDFDWLVNKESSWNPKADNPTSSAYGLLQFLNSTWENGPTDDPREQIRQGLNYIKRRYNNPAEARRFHEAHGWYKDGGVVPDTPAELFSTPTGLYDTGGQIPQGLSQVLNLTGGNEHAAVFTTDQWERLQTGAGGDININLPMMPTNATPADVADEVLFAARRIKRGGAYLGANGSN